MSERPQKEEKENSISGRSNPAFDSRVDESGSLLRTNRNQRNVSPVRSLEEIFPISGPRSPLNELKYTTLYSTSILTNYIENLDRIE